MGFSDGVGMKVELIDQSEAVRQMGREDRKKGLPREAGLRFWMAGSLALGHWEDGWEEGKDYIPNKNRHIMVCSENEKAERSNY